MGTSYYHLYFLFVMTQFYLLFPFLRHLFQKWQGITLLPLMLGITLAAQMLTWSEVQEFIGIHVNEVTVRRSLFPWLFYFAFGGWLGLHPEESLHQLRRFPWTLLSVLLLSSAVLLLHQMVFLDRGGYHTLMTILLSLMVLVLGFRLPQRFRFNWVETAGRYSFGIFLIHPMLLHSLNRLAEGWMLEGTGLWFILWSVSLFAVSLAVTKMLDRTPFGYLLKGR